MGIVSHSPTWILQTRCWLGSLDDCGSRMHCGLYSTAEGAASGPCIRVSLCAFHCCLSYWSNFTVSFTWFLLIFVSPPASATSCRGLAAFDGDQAASVSCFLGGPSG